MCVPVDESVVTVTAAKEESWRKTALIRNSEVTVMCIHDACSPYPDIQLCVVFTRAMSGSLVKLLNLRIRYIARTGQ